MIKITFNKNILFFFFIYNTISNKQTKLHPLGKEIMNKYKTLPKEIDTLKKIYYEKNIPTHPYAYCVFAINTDRYLKSKKISPQSGYGEKLSQIYNNYIYPNVLQIEKELNFFSYIDKDISPRYKLINEDIKKIFSNEISIIFRKIWKIEEDTNLLLFPNVLSTEHSFGVFRENDIFSISSPIVEKDGSIGFNQQNLISNAIHEYSHSILHKFLIGKHKLSYIKNISMDIDIPRGLRAIHNKPEIYIEESFIKALTLFIQEQIFENFMTEKEIREKRNKNLEVISQKGYIYTPVFFSKLNKEASPVDTYIEIVQTITK